MNKKTMAIYIFMIIQLLQLFNCTPNQPIISLAKSSNNLRKTLDFLPDFLPNLGKNQEVQFNYEDSRNIYLIAQLPYGIEGEIRNMTCGLVCENIRGVQVLEFIRNKTDSAKTTSVVSISYEKKEVYFSFKGTHTTAQLIEELIHNSYQPYETEFYKEENAKVMLFFQQVYKDYFQKEIIANLEKYSHYQDEYKFIFNGYSLGGALASLAILDAVSSGIIRVRENSPVLFTHGCPRVGNAIISDYLNERIPVMFRVVNSNDLVPHIPPCNLELMRCVKEKGSYSSFLAGWHTRQEVWINIQGTQDPTDYKVCDNENTEDPKCSDSLYILNPSQHQNYYNLDHTSIINFDE